MKTKEDNTSIDKTPEIFSSIVLCFDESLELETLKKSINHIGITEFKICRPKFEPKINIEIAIVNYESFWSLDDAISKMFSYVDNVLNELKETVKKLDGTFYINIAFFQFGTYPAIVLSRENIEKIAFLEASMGIDPY